ncbi:hypothetical protein DFJ58DRAFT_873775 [Suillus subalutaceus]|uniref:uncharacterized protein n=1 Tax=Suillus subalutaceus TaxID=48586 RepID=UPI001B880B1D|nr:uncharacterized protein DFJ58DRAFT_873775 [Suillus subalutaceus]KAG1830691.1 hypothetical protein DFJ58DRAFT_873775 [Suillus subalutaceus]
MHQALLIPEVLLEIFVHVTETILKPFGPAGNIVILLYRESLAALATTCKAFHDPAMDLLWGEIDIESLLGCVTRLHPLMYCSGRLWNWAEGVRPLSADEVHQFLLIPAELYDFPRLKSLTISTKYLNLFLSHTLHRRYLVTVDEDLRSIVTCCATLEHLNVITPDAANAIDSTSDALSRISDIVRSCKQLVTLSCPLFDWAAWRHLSNLPTLTRLDVGDTRSDPAPPWPLERDIANFSPFSNITALSFLLHSAAYAITVMQHSQFPSLKEFKMDVDFLPLPEAEQLFRALSNCKACETLEKIRVYSSYHKYDPQNNSLSAIPHFHCFTHLRTLHLACFDFCINLDDNILLEAMSTWPHMHDLEIDDLRLHHSPITFRGIFTAIRLCPQLHTLRVPIDSTTFNIDVEPTQHTFLRVLELKTPMFQIANAEALARIIFSCLPRIDRILGSIQCDWDEVNMHIKSLKDAALHVTGAASNT